MRVVLDVNILVRSNDRSFGLARDLLLELLQRRWTILISGEILIEVARVLRYPRLQAQYDLTEDDVYEYVQLLRKVGEFVTPRTKLGVPIRGVADIAIVETAIAGEADFICTLDADFYDPVITAFLSQSGIKVLDDISLFRLLRQLS